MHLTVRTHRRDFLLKVFLLVKNPAFVIISVMKKTSLKTKTKPKVKALPTKAGKKIAVTFPVPKIAGKLVGKVTHYFSDIGVGGIKLSAPLNKGDQIRIIGGESTDFNQSVASMQIDHKEAKKAKKGDAIGLKVKEKVRDGYKVYRVK